MGHWIRKTTEQFITEAKAIHGDKYDYSLVEYNTAKDKVKIQCSIHGVFEQIPNAHLANGGCKQCGSKLTNFKNTFTTEQIITKSKIVHGDKYDYSLVEYIGIYDKIKIICPIHGEFEQQPDKHINGKCGCYECGIDKLRSSQEDFIKQVNEIHNNRYDYSLVNYVDTRTKVKIICQTHGEFETKPNWHLNGRGCPICNASKGEIKINKHLTENNIEFIPQHKFDDCVNKNKLPFDFFLPDHNMCIEFDGKQHFEPIDFFGGVKHLEKVQHNDRIKNKYCKDNNIKLIRIKYNEDVIEKLKTTLK